MLTLNLDPTLPIQKQKAQLRKLARRERNGTPYTQRILAAQQLCQRITHQPWFNHAERIALYIPNDGEIDPTGLLNGIERRRATNKTFYLPVIEPIQRKRLWFLEYRHLHQPLYLNQFHIPEPTLRSLQTHKAHPRSLDLILLPLVGFDSTGKRLGMGGGFYDRTLAQANLSPTTKKIGVAFERQRFDHLPTESWDIPLDGIITEAGFYPT